MTIIQVRRFLDKVDTSSGPDACWPYGHNVAYGMVNLNGKTFLATHVMWFLTFGVWPTLLLLHDCDNPPCVNLRHIKEGTHSQNLKDMVARNRDPKAGAKLSPQEVLLIRQRRKTGETLKSLATAFNVTEANISYVISKTWKNVMEETV